MINYLLKESFPGLSKRLSREVPFLLIIGGLSILCALTYQRPDIAMWIGFGIAGYSAIANDSIQTLGTFLSSHKRLPWWVLWIFIGGVLAVVLSYGWYTNGGDLSYERLNKIPQPTSFTFLALAAPIMLLILTRLKMPVSTTFLLLSAFSSGVVIQKMLMKTFSGYIIAFGFALLVWTVLAWLYHHKEFPSDNYNRRKWRYMQAASTTFLWATWITHDTANVAVFLPRVLSANQAALAIGYLVAVIGLIMYFKGGRIQEIVTEKTDITDVRAATIIDFVYAIVLVYFKQINDIPMSTTWVFLGLLAGREIALTMFTHKPEVYWRTSKLVFRDIGRASFGLLLSLLIVLFMIGN